MRTDAPAVEPESGPSTATRRDVLGLLRESLGYARRRDYRGWDYCDGMSSRVRRALPVESRVTNLLFQEGIKRAPVNVRPYLLVEPRRNFLGTGLFATANLAAHRLSETPAGDVLGGVDYAGEAIALLDWLVDNGCPGYAGFCGSHRHRIQQLDHVSETTDPSITSTVFPALALLDGSTLDAPRTSEYAAVARSAEEFVLEDLDYRTVEGAPGARINYSANASGDHYTINGGALAARLFLALYDHTGERRHRERATALLDYIATLQTDRGGWHYRHPTSASHLSMDNFHNGFVVECFLRYADAVDDRYAGVIDDALAFYRTVFDASGAPDWDEESAYPRDVHACAQGVLVFSYAGDDGFARRILNWTLDELYGDDGGFRFRKHRYYTKRVTLMRWCQAWMCYAMAEHLRVTNGLGSDVPGLPAPVR